MPSCRASRRSFQPQSPDQKCPGRGAWVVVARIFFCQPSLKLSVSRRAFIAFLTEILEKKNHFLFLFFLPFYFRFVFHFVGRRAHTRAHTPNHTICREHCMVTSEGKANINKKNFIKINIKKNREKISLYGGAINHFMCFI